MKSDKQGEDGRAGHAFFFTKQPKKRGGTKRVGKRGVASSERRPVRPVRISLRSVRPTRVPVPDLELEGTTAGVLLEQEALQRAGLEKFGGEAQKRAFGWREAEGRTL